MKAMILGALATTILIIAGINVFSRLKATSPPPRSQDFLNTVDTPPNQEVVENSQNLLANNYYNYSKDEFDTILESGKGVVLFFYANWCPTCAAQEPIMQKAMNAGVSQGKPAVRINFNDTDTDTQEKELAKKYGVTYQHTFVVIDNKGNELFQVTGNQSAEQIGLLFTRI